MFFRRARRARSGPQGAGGPRATEDAHARMRRRGPPHEMPGHQAMEESGVVARVPVRRAVGRSRAASNSAASASPAGPSKAPPASSGPGFATAASAVSWALASADKVDRTDWLARETPAKASASAATSASALAQSSGRGGAAGAGRGGPNTAPCRPEARRAGHPGRPAARCRAARRSPASSAPVACARGRQPEPAAGMRQERQQRLRLEIRRRRLGDEPCQCSGRRAVERLSGRILDGDIPPRQFGGHPLGQRPSGVTRAVTTSAPRAPPAAPRRSPAPLPGRRQPPPPQMPSSAARMAVSSTRSARVRHRCVVSAGRNASETSASRAASSGVVWPSADTSSRVTPMVFSRWSE